MGRCYGVRAGASREGSEPATQCVTGYYNLHVHTAARSAPDTGQTGCFHTLQYIVKAPCVL